MLLSNFFIEVLLLLNIKNVDDLGKMKNYYISIKETYFTPVRLNV